MDDEAIPEDTLIALAHPVNTKDFETYNEAQRLVGAKSSKGALVELVNWLMAERKAAALAAGQELQRVRGELEVVMKDAAAHAREVFEIKQDLDAAEVHGQALSSKLHHAEREVYDLEAKLRDATVEDKRGVPVRLTREEIALVSIWGSPLTQNEIREGVAQPLLAKLRALPPRRGQ